MPHDAGADSGRRSERPTQIDMLIAGDLQPRYLSARARVRQTDRLLDWWSDRLRRDCRVDPVYGYFVDQRWFDLAPGLVSTYPEIARDTRFSTSPTGTCTVGG